MGESLPGINGERNAKERNAKFEERERKFEEPDGTGTQNEIGFPGTRERERKTNLRSGNGNANLKRNAFPFIPGQDSNYCISEIMT